MVWEERGKVGMGRKREEKVGKGSEGVERVEL